MVEEDNQNLIREIVNGNREIFGTVIKQYQKLVFTLVFRMIKDEDESKDVVQDVFIKVFQNLNKFNGKSKLSTWISTIAFRQTIDYLKKKKRFPVANWENPISYDPSETIIEARERQMILTRAIDSLKPQDSAIITLYYLEEKSLTEISQITGISVNNLKARLFKSRKILKNILKKVDKTVISEFYEK
ncbi:MAG: RNA polymerase sigma factor [Sphingobacterium sp.]